MLAGWWGVRRLGQSARPVLDPAALAELRALYPEAQLEVFSDSTPRTADALFAIVQRDRERGYVLQEGFFESSISTIAAPSARTS